jgi:hypothetical protein
MLFIQALSRPSEDQYGYLIMIPVLYPNRKEWGFFSTYYTYITVFIRNAANLTLLLLKSSKLRKGNKN